MIEWIFIVLCAGLNRLRGWGPVDKYVRPDGSVARWRKVAEVLSSKYACALYLGGVCWPIYGWPPAMIVAGGYALWAMRGWGDYFDFSKKPNRELAWIDAITRRLAAPWRDVAAMSLRGLYFYPAAIGLAWWVNSWHPLALGVLILLQGPVYLLAHRLDVDDRRGVKTVAAELAMGGIIGGIIAGGL